MGKLTTAFLSERTEFYNYMPSDISSFINNLKNELKVLDEKFKNNPFVNGFCNLHPELIKTFENFSKIKWGGDYNDFMHIEINPSYNNDIIK